MKRRTPAFFAAITIGSKAAGLMVVGGFSSSPELPAVWLQGAVDAGVAAGHRLEQAVGVADVAAHAFQARGLREQPLVAEVHRVVDADLVALCDELRHEQAADIAGAARDQDVLELVAHAAARGAMA